ncbi:UNKNOWN [Stylonychia lemnae]|uniref:Uncharacterized protein n=1 Tax=Stylonychia lemnae TaxID=5949 RepID=A0A078AFM1_STYLE|nr:UNKNOWN [Stylonychia lemnae]|eukprot:CDW81020.1 UNKNOWN [Stylonychia lemnae]
MESMNNFTQNYESCTEDQEAINELKKQCLRQQIEKNSLRYILQKNLRLELFHIFQSKYSVITFEYNQVNEVLSFIDILIDDFNVQNIYLNYPKYQIDYKKIEILVINDPKIVNIQTISLATLLQQLNPYFEEEKMFLTQVTQILKKFLNNQPFNDQEKCIVSLDKPFGGIDIYSQDEFQDIFNDQHNYDSNQVQHSNITESVKSIIADSVTDYSLNDDTISLGQNPAMIVDDIQKSILKDQKQKKKKNKKKKKKTGLQLEVQNPKKLINQNQYEGQIEEIQLKSDEEDFIPTNSQSGQILSDIFMKLSSQNLNNQDENVSTQPFSDNLIHLELKKVRNSPIISQIILELYLQLMEAKNEKSKEALAKEDIITELRQQKLDNIQQNQRNEELFEQLSQKKKDLKRIKKQAKGKKKCDQLVQTVKQQQKSEIRSVTSKDIQTDLMGLSLNAQADQFLVGNKQSQMNDLNQISNNSQGYIDDIFLLDFIYLRSLQEQNLHNKANVTYL